MVLQLFSRWETPISDNHDITPSNKLTQSDIIYMDTKALFVQILRTLPTIPANAAKNVTFLFKVAEGNKLIEVSTKYSTQLQPPP